MCRLGQIIEIDEQTRYFFASQHRGRKNDHKSKWIISLSEEFECFQRTCNNSWIGNCSGWGLHIQNDRVEYLGKNNQEVKLRIAKFVDKHSDGTWHGYPADYMVKIQDRPDETILKDWVYKRYIDKVCMARILCGKRSGM